METTTYAIVYSVTNLSAGPSKDLDALVSAIGEWTSIWVRGKDLSMTGGLLDRAPPAMTASAVSGRLPASSLCLIPMVWCSRPRARLH